MTLWLAAYRSAWFASIDKYAEARRKHRPSRRAWLKMKRRATELLREELEHG